MDIYHHIMTMGADVKNALEQTENILLYTGLCKANHPNRTKRNGVRDEKF